MARRDSRTLDMFKEWTPPVVAHDEVHVRSSSFRGRLSRAISTTLKECGMERAEVAAAMTEVGVQITENVLNRAASESDAEHMLSAERLWALCRVTGDWRLIAVLLEGSDKVIVDSRWLYAVEEAEAAAEEEEHLAAAGRAATRRKAARRKWSV